MKLFEQIKNVIRLKQYSYRTEKIYTDWIKRFIIFHNNKHPRDMDNKEIIEFITYLVVKRNVSSSTQNQALQAILFLYNQVLEIKIDNLGSISGAKKPRRIPNVLSKNEVSQVLSHLSGIHLLITKMMYGSGLRLSECLCLRIKDIDFEQNYIVVRNAKGFKDRIVPLPQNLVNIIKKTNKSC